MDSKLSWEAHLLTLKRTLNYASATLCRIRDSVPQELHCDLYHTLFESHLTYCISVWGGASKIDQISVCQKHCIRVLFGDKEAYLDKFKTCVRARPYPDQALTEKFFQREHTKPLFKKHSILAVKNLYSYHVFMETFKILKFRQPFSLFEDFRLSSRKETTLITPILSNDFIYRSTSIWNSIAPKLRLADFSHNTSLAKSRLKKALFRIQNFGDSILWTDKNFDRTEIEHLSKQI